MSKKGKRYKFHSTEPPEELLTRIEEGVSLYNSERLWKELKFTQTESGFCLEVMRANFGAYCYEAEVFPRGGTEIDGRMRYIKEEDNFSPLTRFFHKAGFVVFWIIFFPVFLIAGCIIRTRLRANGSPLTKEKTLTDFMENFAFCEREKEEHA